jgi:RNA polymerase sigma-70 factor (ECF subfamily)
MQATNCIPQTAATTSDSVAAARPDDVALLFGELRRPLLRYLLSLSLSPAEAEDIVQEAFLRLCQQFTAGPCFNVRAWIFRVSHNLALDQHRRRGRAPEALDHDEFSNPAVVLTDSCATPEQQAIDRQRAQRLHEALLRLPIHQQHCLHLRAEGLRYREIAEVLGAGTSTVADWVQAALERLGKELK